MDAVRARRYNARMAADESQYVTRAGAKLAAALDGLGIDVAGWVCADLGCNVGGFTDCLLQRAAARVTAVDTGYGALAWKLRTDERVIVRERTNALHCEPTEPADLVVIDVGWTPQRLILPAAKAWLKPEGQILSLLKPHYEAAARAKGRRPHGKQAHVLTGDQAKAECRTTCEELTAAGWEIRAVAPSAVVGAAGNIEFVLWLKPL